MDDPSLIETILGFLQKYVTPPLAALADLLTIVASAIAIYLFLSQRKAISSFFARLLSYAHQLTLSELRGKLDRLNDLNANENDEREHIENIFNEIIGQIRGNQQLSNQFRELLPRMDALLEKNALTEPRKRSLVAELRERLRHLDVENIDSLSGEQEP